MSAHLASACAAGDDPPKTVYSRALVWCSRTIPVDMSPDSFSREHRPTDSINSYVDRYNISIPARRADNQEIITVLSPTCKYQTREWR